MEIMHDKYKCHSDDICDTSCPLLASKKSKNHHSLIVMEQFFGSGPDTLANIELTFAKGQCISLTIDDYIKARDCIDELQYLCERSDVEEWFLFKFGFNREQIEGYEATYTHTMYQGSEVYSVVFTLLNVPDFKQNFEIVYLHFVSKQPFSIYESNNKLFPKGSRCVFIENQYIITASIPLQSESLISHDYLKIIHEDKHIFYPYCYTNFIYPTENFESKILG